MGAPKGSQNAKAYHDARMEDVSAKLRRALKEIGDSGATYRSLTALSKALAKVVGVSDVRLRQNSVYRLLLDEHMGSTKRQSLNGGPRTDALLALQQEVFGLKLELSNLRASNNRLRAALEKRPETSEHKINDRDLLKDSSGTAREDFECTANLVLAFLNHFQGCYLDTQSEVIIDTASLLGEEVIAGRNLCGPFIRWCLKQKVGAGTSFLSVAHRKKH